MNDAAVHHERVTTTFLELFLAQVIGTRRSTTYMSFRNKRERQLVNDVAQLICANTKRGEIGLPLFFPQRTATAERAAP